MEEAFLKYKDRGLRIAAFPSNSFNQEPKTNAELKTYFRSQNATYDVYAKSIVKGSETIPLYAFMKRTYCYFFICNREILWNYEKFLVGRDGKVVDRTIPGKFSSIESAMEAELN